MNHRQRFLEQMHFGSPDRCPLYDFNTWDETIPAWHAQGLPPDITRRTIGDWLGLDASLGGGENPGWAAPSHCGLWPQFEPEVLSDNGDVYTVRQHDGAIVQMSRTAQGIPPHVGHTLVDRASWEKHYKPRLDPDHPERLARLQAMDKSSWFDDDRDHPIFLGGGSLFGWIRDWMGIENISYVVYDDPAFFEEMVTTVADLQVAMLERALSTGGKFDALSMWEDMCYNAGPLLAPNHFKQYLSPHYRRIADLARKHGIDILWVDCDGKIDDLVPLWLEAGINCMFPIEIGDWADPRKFRDEYGKDLLMMGGFDKHILARSPQAIDAEIDRLTPLVEEGGFIPFCDHRVPPDVPLSNYVHYCRRVREVWGKGVNLKPMPAESADLSLRA